MKYKMILELIMLSIFFGLVFAASDNAPPPIPTEYWGRLIINGSPAPDGTEVKYFNGQEWIITATKDGWYDIILTGGDRPLTYNDDPTCANHWAAGEACIPCTQNVDCVEGPKEGDNVNISGNNVPVSVTWGDNASSEENVIALIPLYAGWNMISLPVNALNDTIQSLVHLLSGTKLVDYYDAATGTWKRYNSGTPPFTWTLLNMEPGKGYWLKVDSNQKWAIVGSKSTPNIVNLKAGWNLVSFRLYNNTVQNVMAQLSGTKLVDYYDASTGTWKRYNSGTPPFTWTLNEINIGKGYWVKVDSDQTWGEP